MNYREFMEAIGDTSYEMAVYVMTAGDGATKIGISNEPKRRVKGMQTGQDRDILIYWAVRLCEKDARAVEREIHDRMRSSLLHSRGEWYNINPATAVDWIKHTIRANEFSARPDLEFGYPLTER